MVNPLEEKRKKIDAIDALLAGLLAERLAVAAALAGLKNDVRGPASEKAVLSRAAGLVKDAKLLPAILAIYREILKQGRRLQKASVQK